MFKKPEKPAMTDLIANIMTKPSIDLEKAYEELMNDVEESDINNIEDQDKPQTPENRLGLL